MLRASSYADQLAACNQAGECFITNDAAPEFAGEVSLRLLNVQTGASTFVQKRRAVTLKAGAGVVEWFCAAPVSSTAPVADSSYEYYPCQTPVAGEFEKRASAAGMTQLQCQAACDANSTCAGFTRAMASFIKSNGCTFFSGSNNNTSFSSFRLGNTGEGADWWQRPSVPAFLDAPSVIPTCKVPEKMQCVGWADIPQWKLIGCLSEGENCVAQLLVTKSGQTATTVSHNVQAFVPPKRMQLSPANVTVEVLRSTVDANVNEVQLSVRTAAGGAGVALYVVLTTMAAGRFSENAFLLAGGAKNVSFLSWVPLTDSAVERLKSSLRVEHLAESMTQHPLLKSDDFASLSSQI
jgi:hypothetical protein